MSKDRQLVNDPTVTACGSRLIFILLSTEQKSDLSKYKGVED